MNVPTDLEKLSKPIRILLGFALIGVVGICDFLTGYELAFSLFYVIPISFLTWGIGRRLGIMASLASALVWLVADVAAGRSYSHPLIPIWNTLIRLSFFLIITWLLSALRSAVEREKEFARADTLTGALNSRLFFEMTRLEIDRLRRYERPFTVVYIDLDNFKTVNDKFGHLTGDQALRTVVTYSKQHLRSTDVIARLGGDEFGLLLPETSQEPARVALSNLQRGLLEEMRQHNWPITFSLGALTCSVAPPTTEEVVRMADELMYSAKRGNKNAIVYGTYKG